MKLALDSGTGPDVAYVSPGAGAGHVSYAQAGHLVELTDIAQERGWDQRHPMDSLMYWQKELGGPIWGVPFDITNVGVFYNKDLFAELGHKIRTEGQGGHQHNNTENSCHKECILPEVRIFCEQNDLFRFPDNFPYSSKEIHARLITQFIPGLMDGVIILPSDQPDCIPA